MRFGRDRRSHSSPGGRAAARGAGAGPPDPGRAPGPPRAPLPAIGGRGPWLGPARVDRSGAADGDSLTFYVSYAFTLGGSLGGGYAARAPASGPVGGTA